MQFHFRFLQHIIRFQAYIFVMLVLEDLKSTLLAGLQYVGSPMSEAIRISS